jgi:hypothetical protein
MRPGKGSRSLQFGFGFGPAGVATKSLHKDALASLSLVGEVSVLDGFTPKGLAPVGQIT